MTSPKKAARPRVYWLLTTVEPRGTSGSQSLMGSTAEARRAARQVARLCQAPVEGFKGGCTSRTFVVWP